MSDSSQALQIAYAAGQGAYGRFETVNPYLPASDLCEAWRAGWESAAGESPALRYTLHVTADVTRPANVLGATPYSVGVLWPEPDNWTQRPLVFFNRQTGRLHGTPDQEYPRVEPIA